MAYASISQNILCLIITPLPYVSVITMLLMLLYASVLRQSVTLLLCYYCYDMLHCYPVTM